MQPTSKAVVIGTAAGLAWYLFMRMREPSELTEPAEQPGSNLISISTADERVHTMADSDFVGSVCLHTHIRNTMQRADRAAAAGVLEVSILAVADLAESWRILGASGCQAIPADSSEWRTLTRDALRENLLRGRSYAVRKPNATGGEEPTLRALMLAFDSDEERAAHRERRFSCCIPAALDSTTAAAALLAFATRATADSAKEAGPTRCVVATGPFRSESGRDVEARLTAALDASNFTRTPGPAMRVYLASRA
jgi:hypothetical protein